jgi:hypothetical protein
MKKTDDALDLESLNAGTSQWLWLVEQLGANKDGNKIFDICQYLPFFSCHPRGENRILQYYLFKK